MERIVIWAVASIGLTAIVAVSEERQMQAPAPRLDRTAWVLLEIFKTGGKDVNTAVYFLDGSFERNRNLCKSTKMSLDENTDRWAEQNGHPRIMTLECMSVSDAMAAGYIMNGNLDSK